MVKLICRGAQPGPKFLRFFFHANPDRLVDLTAEASGAMPEQAALCRRKFTEILNDIYVDGVWKQTSWGRLPETERGILKHLASYSAATEQSRPLCILDLGASDGSTSANLVHAVHEAYSGPVALVLADLNIELRRFHKGLVTEYRTSRGNPVMVTFGPIGVRLPKSEHRWHWLSDKIAQWYLQRSELRAGLHEEGTIPLVNPIAAHEPDIEAIELNCLVFEPKLVGRFDVIRASNLISPRYGFIGQQLENCLSNLHAYLMDGGYLLISRNDRNTEVEHGSIWRRTADGFTLADGFGGGSEIEAEVSSFNATPACMSRDHAAATSNRT